MKSQKDLLLRILGKEKKFLIVVLDACRPDSFRRWISKNRLHLLGDVEDVRSEGRRTPSWFTGTFEDRRFDLTYISGNPYINSAGVTSVGRLAKACFSNVVDAWKKWNGKEQTCMPQTINNFAIARLKEPRLIAHYMQPHQPYVGKNRVPTALYYKERWEGMKDIKERPRILQIHSRKFSKEQVKIVRAAYESNVDLVCSHSFRLIDRAKRLSVITADHSEMMGDGGWFHNCNHPKLQIVPWLRIPN